MVCYRVMIMTKRKQGRKGDMKCFFKFLYIYFLAALALHCCAQAFSSCSERGLLFVAVHGLLVVVASLATEHRL